MDYFFFSTEIFGAGERYLSFHIYEIYIQMYELFLIDS